MRRFWALTGKELREHWLAALLLCFLLGGGLMLLIVGCLAARRTVSVLQAAASFNMVFLSLAAITLGNRLVVAEYHARTQLFVEALPVRRWEMVAVKYALGLACLLACAAGALLLTAALARGSEPVDATFLGILGTRTAAFTVCMWSGFFVMGFLGRFRIPVYLAIALGTSAIAGMTEFEPSRFGPLALMNPHTFPYERREMPWAAVAQTLALAGGCTLTAFALALVHEGSVAEVLARRMSQKEKVVVGLLFVVAVVALAYFQARKTKEPYAFSGEAVLASERAPIEILYLRSDVRPDAADLLRGLERDLCELRDGLGWSDLPPLRVAWREDLDGCTFEDARLERHDGVLVRANFRRREGWDGKGFTAHVLGEVLDHHMRGRATFDPKQWVQVGFARWWAEQRGGAIPVGLSQALLRAVWGTRAGGVSGPDLLAWSSFAERLGERMAEGVACSGLAALESLRGRAAVLALARAVFGRQPYRDFRETLYERAHPIERVFAEATGLAWSDFLAAWNGWLDRLRAQVPVRAALAAVPEGRAEVSIEPGPGQIRDVVYRLEFTRPPAPGAPCVLLHQTLGPFDHWLDPTQHQREEHAWEAGATAREWRLEGRYGRGVRVFLALEVESATLGCPVRLASERRDVE